MQRLAQQACLWTQAGLLAIASRDHQRAEYCADALAARLAGTAGTVALMDDLVASFHLSGAVEAAERRTRAAGRAHPGVVEWRAAAVECRTRLDLAELRKQSVVAEASMWTHHPPSGLRARIVESWPHQEPSLVLSAEDSERIDAELHRWYAKAGRDLAWS
ncbi:hypothetical protein FKR81_29690 [Lentzea tibetensis]|uniref:Uncharacterized protein n=1 Tax=Lentzea tibetensis TaxID=2591470 RepID=A0A563ELX9_9PSEU|nr:hypothetical protein [Lentzea tibetensis]TWP48154.1 hypothetical protein FKR81_29690 [Lentzea tibetensis]